MRKSLSNLTQPNFGVGALNQSNISIGALNTSMNRNSNIKKVIRGGHGSVYNKGGQRGSTYRSSTFVHDSSLNMAAGDPSRIDEVDEDYVNTLLTTSDEKTKPSAAAQQQP